MPMAVINTGERDTLNAKRIVLMSELMNRDVTIDTSYPFRKMTHIYEGLSITPKGSSELDDQVVIIPMKVELGEREALLIRTLNPEEADLFLTVVWQNPFAGLDGEHVIARIDCGWVKLTKGTDGRKTLNSGGMLSSITERHGIGKNASDLRRQIEVALSRLEEYIPHMARMEVRSWQ